MKLSFCGFDTPVGQCGIVWSGQGIVGTQLPEASDADTFQRLLSRHPEAQRAEPPAFVRSAMDRIVALLTRGDADDLSTIELDMSGIPAFHRKVYAVCRTIPPGRTATYGEVAALSGSPGAARAVGQALARNPFAIVVPCHRVMAAGGKDGGFSAAGGVATKRRLLQLETSGS